MNVGIVRMRVDLGLVLVLVRVRLASVPRKIV